MSSNDFEVLPRGTTEELKILRQFARSMIALSSIHDMPVPHEMRSKINEISRFYDHHVESYPV